MQSIVFTGGGSAGHVTPNLPLIRPCLKDQYLFFILDPTRVSKKTS
jgi:UDP-N-acetylglucosamine:LPS N-acetylglucosamine transferase